MNLEPSISLSYISRPWKIKKIDLKWIKFVKRQVTVWPEPIWIKVKKSWLVLPQHQNTYPWGPKSVSIESPPFRPHFIKFSKIVFYEVDLVSQCSHLEVLLRSKFGSERGDFNWCWFWSSKVCTLMMWWYLSPARHFYSDWLWPYCDMWDV